MSELEKFRAALPETAKDIKLNLQSVLEQNALSPSQRWGVAIATAAASRSRPLLDAVLAEARERHKIDAAVIDDAKAAASLMAMNNVYYRFRHLVGKPSYSDKHPRLRMNRMVKPAASKIDFELYSLAVSAINGCEVCIQAHEKVVAEGGITEEQVNDAIRIAATMSAAAVAFETVAAD